MTVRVLCLLSIMTALAIPAFAAPVTKAATSGYVQPAPAADKAESGARVPTESKRDSSALSNLKSYDLWIRDVDGGVVDRFVTNSTKKYATSPTPRAKTVRRTALGPVD
jgi:hypothetical protein